ncbi:MAG: transglutaminase family protein, partial [Solirubrobacteraceae bacterium]|nr:transglutaminase family protein [Solirubrobacteraceae bacterium]
MSIHVAIEHKTKYLYDRPVSLGPQVVRLRPAPHTRTPILSYSLKIEPEDHFINWVQDPTGNYLARLIFPELTTEFSVTVDLVADMTVINPFDFFIAEEAEVFPFEYEPELKAELAPYFKSEKTPKAVKQWLKKVPKKGLKTLDMLVALNKHVAETVDYSVRMEPGIQSPELTLERGVGSCRDSAWLLVHAIRHRGIAARFASGYLIQLKEDLQPVGQPPGPQMDFTDLHAWAEAYVPGAGWIGLDATSGLLTSEGHIPLACSADPINAAPITGNVSKAKTEFEFSNTITRLHEPPRVTLPYTDAQWKKIDDLGRAVDLRLRGSDARLTMGGEPTFVAAAEPDAPEWNTDALGGRKHELAVDLGFRLAGKFASGAMIRHGQGKWYPGEPLPRWQVGVHWRADGQPLWNDQALLANPTAPGKATKKQVKKLAEALADGLGIGAEQLVPAYEDTLNELLNEAKLPGGEPPELVDPDPEDTRIADANERAKLIAKLDAATGEPTGWALPLHRDDGADHWITGTWTLRRGKLF